MPIIRTEPGQDVGELARQLVEIADAEGLPQPETDTGGVTLAFVVSEELLASYEGAPSKKLTPEPVKKKPVQGDDDEGAGKSRRGRKKSKGDK